VIPVAVGHGSEAAMIGRQSGDQTSLFYEFRLDDRIPKEHLLRRIEGFVAPILVEVREQLKSYYSKIGRPSVDPELMIHMLIVGYCYGLRLERRLPQEVELHLAYRWFCRLDLDDKIPHHSTFSENRLHRFREHAALGLDLIHRERFRSGVASDQRADDSLGEKDNAGR
jgi:transposase